jgi:predicted  nucleic acid-binding Zn-ribbon protein
MTSNANEVLRLIREIQALKLELDTLRRLGEPSPEALEKERALDRLHWRLAAVARHAASNDLGAAA